MKRIAVLVVLGLLASTALASYRPVEDGRDLKLVFSINTVGYIDVCGCKKKKVRQGSV